ncbi:MAG: hypothetical protein JWM16_1160 [Verrucomicrobiales bacterium]|nr:hypothetical protein [Verrucomicrobiales bacterium]
MAGLAITQSASAQPLVNLGLVGVGRISANTLDTTGNDTLGGIFSGMWLAPGSVTKSGETYNATIYALPDRGFGDGFQNFHPRVQTLQIAITPHYGNASASQTQIVMSNTATHVLTAGGKRFTGANPDDTSVTDHPQALAGGVGEGLWSLDSEGIAFANDGSFYISDEYGPFIYHINPAGETQNVLVPPAAYIPRVGTNFPRAIDYNTALNPTNDSGRYNNRGLEGLSITPDGKRLVTILQSPLAQDGESRNPSRNTRILVYDVEAGSPNFEQPIAEYVHVLPLNAAEAMNRHTPVSEILALSEKRFLILQRDSRGLGGDAGPLLYKRIVMVDASKASNFLGTGYDFEKGAPGQIALPRAGLPSNIVAVASQELVDLLNGSQLAKYGLNLSSANQDTNTICEKWEGMAVLPLNDPGAPSDYLLLVGNDNDFKATIVYHNGVAVGTNEVIVDNMLLAFRIGEDHIAPTLACPGEVTVAASATCTLPMLAGMMYASDNSAASLSFSQNLPPGTTVVLGQALPVTLMVTDAAGNSSVPCTIQVTVVDKTKPVLKVPTNIVAATDKGRCGAVVNFSVTATDNCSTPKVVCNPASGTNFPTGTNAVTCTATDDSGNAASATFPVIVNDLEAPAIRSIKLSDHTLWPADKKLEAIRLKVEATDNCDSHPWCRIVEVTSSEPVSGRKDKTAPDWVITGPLTLKLRAERSEKGPGRIYTITVQCTDSSGNSSQKQVTVDCPRHKPERD